MIKRRTNYDVVLRALMAGVDVTIDNCVYRLVRAGEPIVAMSGDYESDHDVLCMVLNSSNGKAYTLPADLTMNNFFAICDTITEAERVDIIASHALTTLNKPINPR